MSNNEIKVVLNELTNIVTKISTKEELETVKSYLKDFKLGKSLSKLNGNLTESSIVNTFFAKLGNLKNMSKENINKDDIDKAIVYVMSFTDIELDNMKKQEKLVNDNIENNSRVVNEEDLAYQI